LKDQAPNDIKLKEIKVSEDSLKFPSSKLNELSEDCKRYHIGRYLQYLQYMWGAYSYLFLDAQYQSDFSLMQTYNKYRHQIPLIIKNKILKRLTERLGHDDSSISIHVNRKKAKDFTESGKVDDKGEHTVFS
jgi:hypothetical protein